MPVKTNDTIRQAPAELAPGNYLIGKCIGLRKLPAREGYDPAYEAAIDYGNVFAGNTAVYLPITAEVEVGQQVAIRLDPGRRPKFYAERQEA